MARQRRPPSDEALQFTAATAGNIARAAVENIGDRLSGRAHFGTRLGQMSEELERKAAVREEERGVRADLSVAVFTLMFTVASVSNLAFDDRS